MEQMDYTNYQELIEDIDNYVSAGQDFVCCGGVGEIDGYKASVMAGSKYLFVIRNEETAMLTITGSNYLVAIKDMQCDLRRIGIESEIVLTNA